MERAIGNAGKIARLIILLSILGLADLPHAQECSGGPDGGTDATGHQCNSPGAA